MYSENEVILIKDDGTEQRVTNPDLLPQGINIAIKGCDNRIFIHESAVFNNFTLKLSKTNKATVIIGKQCHIKDMVADINSGVGQKLEICDGTTFFGGKIVLRDKDYIKIGKGCLFAAGLSMWATDAHTVIDMATQTIINETPEKLEIGENCWIGADVHILKGGSLAPNTVVGMCSVVTKPFTKPNTVIGGYPAKILRENIEWSRQTIPNWKRLHADKK